MRPWVGIGVAMMIAACGGGGSANDGGPISDGANDASADAGPPAYTCTDHVTPSTLDSAFAAAGAGSVLCLAPGSYGSWAGGAKTSMVVLTPDVAAGAKGPTGNATGGADGNVLFAGLSFTDASFITLDGVTFTDDAELSGKTHDVTLHGSLFHGHLQIDDTSMNGANNLVDFDSFPGDAADCIGGPEGRIQIGGSNGPAPDGVTIQNSDIGGVPSVQCDGIQSGASGAKILGNWVHDFHYQGAAHTDGIQLYGSQSNVIIGNFFYDVPDGIVAYDGMSNEDIENNVVVNDSAKDDGASPNQFDLLANTGTSVIRHNTVVGGLNAFGGTEGDILIGTKGPSCTGLALTDNVATSISNGDSGGDCTYTGDYDLLQQGGDTGSHGVQAPPIYRGGDCGNLTVDPPGKCGPVWSNFLLAPTSPGHLAADDGTDMGAYGDGPKTPGGP